MQRIPMDFASGDDFEARTDDFLRRYLRRGVPSLFSSMKPIYKRARAGSGWSSTPALASANAERVTIIGKLIDGYLASLRNEVKREVINSCRKVEGGKQLLSHSQGR